MYERTFGTDWEELDRDEVLHRAFALGVSESLDEPVPEGEFDRLVDQVSGRYGQSLVELAYDEGRNKAGRPSPDTENEEVWSSLVEGEGTGEVLTGPRRGAARPARRTDLPESIGVPAFLADRRDDLAKLGFPEFLR